MNNFLSLWATNFHIMATTFPQKKSITRDNATSILLSKIFPLLGESPKGKDLMYSFLEENEKFFSFIAAVHVIHDLGEKPVDRYRVNIDCVSGDVQPPVLISLSMLEIENAILQGTGHHLAKYARFNDGALSISYIASVKEDPEIEYVVQLRHHGDVASMNAIMELVSESIEPHILPVPAVYHIANEREQQLERGLGIQITRFIPGVMASECYPSMSHEDRLLFVRKFAAAFDALWRLPLPEKRLIGELRATRDNCTKRLEVGPDRHYSLGGPFSSVSDYLRAKIRGSLIAFQKQECIEEYKSRYLERVTKFVEAGMYNIPTAVEQIPIVPIHSDMGLHNVIVSGTNPTEIMAIIDWEFCACAPYATAEPLIEGLFRKWSPNGFGIEFPRADELRSAFWEAIPDWKKLNESEATKVFLEWFQFASFMKAEPLPDDFDDERKEAWWAKNVATTEGFLQKYDITASISILS
jgi:hypothetical protein